jgi:hypothetical protein
LIVGARAVEAGGTGDDGQHRRSRHRKLRACLRNPRLCDGDIGIGGESASDKILQDRRAKAAARPASSGSPWGEAPRHSVEKTSGATASLVVGAQAARLNAAVAAAVIYTRSLIMGPP